MRIAFLVAQGVSAATLFTLGMLSIFSPGVLGWEGIVAEVVLIVIVPIVTWFNWRRVRARRGKEAAG